MIIRGLYAQDPGRQELFPLVAQSNDSCAEPRSSPGQEPETPQWLQQSKEKNEVSDSNREVKRVIRFRQCWFYSAQAEPV